MTFGKQKDKGVETLYYAGKLAITEKEARYTATSYL